MIPFRSEMIIAQTNKFQDIVLDNATCFASVDESWKICQLTKNYSYTYYIKDITSNR